MQNCGNFGRWFFIIVVGFGLFISPGTGLWANFTLAEKAYQNKVYNFAIINYLKVLDQERDSNLIETSLYRLANSYYQVGDYAQALKWIKEYQRRYPESTTKWAFESKYLEILIYFNQKRFEETKDSANELIKGYPEHPEVAKLMLLLAQVLNQQGKSSDALEVLERLERSINNYEADSDFLKARINYSVGNDQTAMALINQVNKANLKVFNFDEAVDLQVEILLRLQNYEMAFAVINENFYRLKNKVYQDKFRFYQSHIFFLQKEYTKAIISYKDYLGKVINEGGDSPYKDDAIFFLGLSYFENEEPIIALDYIGQLEKLEQETPEILSASDRARRDKLAYLIYQKLNRQDRQQDYLNRLYYPDSPEELFALKEKLKWSALNAPNTLSTGAVEGEETSSSRVLSSEQMRFIRRFEEIEKISEERAVFYSEMSRIYFADNNPILGKYFSERAFRSSSNSSYLLALADRLAASKEFAQANQVYETLAPNVNGYEKHYVYDAWGYSLFQVSKYDESINIYGFNTNAGEPAFRASAIFYLGENHRLLQRYENARKYFRQFLKDYPNDERSGIAYLNLGFIDFFGNQDYRGALRNLDLAYEKISQLDDKDSTTAGSNDGGSTINNITAGIDRKSFLNNIIELRFRSYLELGNEEKAKEEVTRINQREFPDQYYNSLFLLGKFYFNKQDYGKALNNYYGIINSENSEVKPNDEIMEKAYYERVAIKLKQKSGREAYFYLQKLRERFPKSRLIDEGYLSVGDYYFTAQRWISTETVYNELAQVSTDPEIVMYSMYYLGYAQLEQDKKTESYQQFRSIKEIGKSKNIFNTVYYDALFELGLLEFENKRFSESQQNFGEIVANSKNKTLVQKAQQNLNIIERTKDPSPYKGLNNISEINQKINSLSSPTLKEQGYLLIAKNHLAAKNYQEVFNALKPIPPSSVYYYDSVILNLEAFLVLKNYKQTYEYAIGEYFRDGFKMIGKNREFFYYALAFSAKQLALKNDYDKFFKLLKKEFPNTTYLKN